MKSLFNSNESSSIASTSILTPLMTLMLLSPLSRVLLVTNLYKEFAISIVVPESIHQVDFA
jgi:hypothetical protein